MRDAMNVEALELRSALLRNDYLKPALVWGRLPERPCGAMGGDAVHCEASRHERLLPCLGRPDPAEHSRMHPLPVIALRQPAPLASRHATPQCLVSSD